MHGERERERERVRATEHMVYSICPGRKIGKVSPAHIQGLENNLRHLQDRAVVQGNHAETDIAASGGGPVQVQPDGAQSEEGERQHGGGALVVDTSVSSVGPTCLVATEPVLDNRVPRKP